MGALAHAYKVFNFISPMVLGLLLAASIAVPSALTYHYGWGPISQGTSTKNFMTWFYFKPWTRFSPYMVGILLGYVLHNTKSKPFKMPQVTNFSWNIVINIFFFQLISLLVKHNSHFFKDSFGKLPLWNRSVWKGSWNLNWNISIGCECLGLECFSYNWLGSCVWTR